MSAPLIVAIDRDADDLRNVETTLRSRYAQDYRIVCTRSPHPTKEVLRWRR